MVRRGFVFLRLFISVIALSVVIPTVHPTPVGAFTARNLMYGSQGYDVDELQSRLRLLGYYWGDIDGDFGWKTYWAVRTFQYNFGMKVTGEVDMATKLKLVKATPNWHYQGSSGGIHLHRQPSRLLLVVGQLADRRRPPRQRLQAPRPTSQRVSTV